MSLIPHGPYQSIPFEPLIINSCKLRGKAGKFFHNFAWVVIMHRVSHSAGNQAYNLPIVFSSFGQWNGLIEHPYPSFCIGKSTILLKETTGRKHYMGEFCGLCHKKLLYDKEIKLFHGCPPMT